MTVWDLISIDNEGIHWYKMLSSYHNAASGKIQLHFHTWFFRRYLKFPQCSLF